VRAGGRAESPFDNRPGRAYTAPMSKKIEQKPKRRQKTARRRAALKHKARRRRERKSGQKRVMGRG
jgi:hypothetical protein